MTVRGSRPGQDIQVALDKKHPVLIGVAMQYTNADGDAVWGTPAVFTGDLPLIPHILSIGIRYLGTGEVIPTVLADPDASKIYVKVGIGSAPADPTATVKDATIIGSAGEPAGTGRFADFGEYVYVSARAENKDGGLGPAKVTAFHRGDASHQAPRVHVTAIRSAVSVVITLEIDDATLAATSAQYKRREGTGSLSGTWQNTWGLGGTGVIGTDAQIFRTRTISALDGLDGEFHWRVQYTNENGDIETIGDSINLANLQATAKTITVPAWDFAGLNIEQGSVTHTSGVQDTDNVHPTTAGIAGTAAASVDIPGGATVTRIQAFGYRENAGDAVIVKLIDPRWIGLGAGRVTLATITLADGGYSLPYVTGLSHVTGGGPLVVEVVVNAAAAKDEALLNYVDVDYSSPSYNVTR